MLKTIAAITTLFCSLLSFSQQRIIHVGTEIQSGYTSDSIVPFWLRSRQYGSIPPGGLFLSVIPRVSEEYDSTNKNLLDWGFGIECRINVRNKIKALLTECYVKGRIGIVELKAGRSKEVVGLMADTSLSSGSFSVSGNALGIPKVELSIPEFRYVFGSKLFAFRGNFAHGWLGEVPIHRSPFVTSAKTYFHQKTLYGRFGKPNWKLKLLGGFNHQVFWGDEKNIYRNEYKRSQWQTYEFVLMGRNAATANVAKVGNHLGTIDLGFEYDFGKLQLRIYRQNFYDAGALGHLANIKDGLNGITIINTSSNKAIRLDRLLLEFLYTKDQGGELDSRWSPSGDEDYYNHGSYKEGWSYNGEGLGTPFISSRLTTRQGFAMHPNNYFINNRVVLFHIGARGSIKNWIYTGKLSYSKNYGTYATSLIGTSIGRRRDPPQYGIFQQVKQFSGFIELSKDVKNGFTLYGAVALDYGKLLPNSFGTMLKLSKSF